MGLSAEPNVHPSLSFTPMPLTLLPRLLNYSKLNLWSGAENHKSKSNMAQRVLFPQRLLTALSISFGLQGSKFLLGYRRKLCSA